MVRAVCGGENMSAQWSVQWRRRQSSHPLPGSLLGPSFLPKWRAPCRNLQFGVTAATDEVRQVGSTFLQLKLTIDTGGGVREDRLLELSPPQFFQ